MPHRDRVQPQALTQAQRARILAVLAEPRFRALSPARVWACLHDEGVHLASLSTFYRVLRRADSRR